MPNEPKPRSFQILLSDSVDAFLSRSPNGTDLRPGSVLLSLFEAAAQNDFRIQQDIFAVLNSFSIDRAEGNDLDKLANDQDVSRLTSIPATGKVTIKDISFTKISSKIYPGTSAPNIGATVIDIADASDVAGFPSSGQIYIGRGTANIEGPLNYISKAQVGAYWQLTLSLGTSKFHNLSESVVLAQRGNRFIPSGTTAQTSQADAATAVQFITTLNVIIPDGEDTFIDVPVVCTKAGTLGNIPRNAITELPSAPVPNLTAFNPLPFVTGRDEETDSELRERIRKAIQSRARGTALAIENSVLGLSAIDEPKTILSSKIIEQAGFPTSLVIDDGSGYEELFAGLGQVSIVDRALGGEKFLQLPNKPVLKAQLITTIEGPFNISGGEILAIQVGGVRYEHTFSASNFQSPGAASGFEISSSINGNSDLGFLATTSGDGSKVRIFSKTENNEDLLVLSPTLGTDANSELRFNEDITYTLSLYKNDVLLYKDGIIPTINSTAQSAWANTITNGDTLILNVDGTGDVTYTITDADFVSANTGFSSVNKNNTLAAWVLVLNRKLTGVTVSVNGAKLKLESNKGANNSASLVVNASSTLVTKSIFTVSVGLSSTGLASDYDFNRNTGQISLTTPLLAGENVTAGSKFTQGYVQTDDIASGAVVLSSTARLWIVVDGDAENITYQIPTGASLQVSSIGDNVWRYSAVGNLVAFTNVQVNDWFVAWDSGITAANNRGFWRVVEVGTSGGAGYIEVEKSSGTAATYTMVGAGGLTGIAFARSVKPMQQISIPAAGYTLSALTSYLNGLLIGAKTTIVSSKLRITPTSYDIDGGLMLVTADASGQTLPFDLGLSVNNRLSHTAFAQSGNKEIGTPLFIHDSLATGTAIEPPLSLVSSFNFEPYRTKPTYMLGFLRPLGVSDRISSNRKNWTQLDTLASTALTLVSKNTLHEIITGTVDDRVYPAMPYDFDGADSLVALIDNDALNKTFSIPFARNIKINNLTAPTATTFNAYDTDRGPTGSLNTTFGTSYSFNEYKVWGKARNILNPTGNVNALVYRAADFGPNGDLIKVAYGYPTIPNIGISHTITTGKFTNVKINLPSDVVRTLSHTNLTQYNVTIGGSGPFTITYTWDGVNGTTPDFVANAVVVGDIVTITNVFNANNRGTYRITAVTASSITITRESVGTAESSIVLANTANLQIYPLAGTNTAQDVKDYVDANLSLYITATATTEDPTGTPNDLTGTITLSTLDQNNYRSAVVAGGGAVRAGNIVTITTTGAHNFVVGDTVILSGISVGSLDFNGEWAIESAPLATTFTFAQIGANETQGGGLVKDSGYKKLLDGENWIEATALASSPQLTIKKAFAFSHTLYSLINEELKLIPTKTSHLIAYTNTLGVTGLSSVAIIGSSDQEARFQIASKLLGSSGSVQVTGGTANSTAGAVLGSASTVDTNFTKVRISGTQKQGFHVGQFVKITSTTPQEKSLGFDATTNIDIIPGSPNILNLTGAGSFKTAKATSANGTTVYQLELQGDFACVVHHAGTAPNFALAGLVEGDWITIGSGFNALNQGTFRCVRVFNDSVYLEIPNAVEEITTAGASLTVVSYNSVLPGDILKLSAGILGSGNNGSFTISAVISSTQIQVLGTMVNDPGNPTNLGSNFSQFQVIDSATHTAIKRIYNVAYNPADLNQLDLILEGTAFATKINAAAGSSITALNKLAFDTSINIGIDGYKYYLGLIAEANRVVYGDPSNPTSYPGVKAAGAQLNIQGPIIKRIQIAYAIRTRTGIPFNDIEDEIKNATSAIVNNVPVGSPVVISDLISAVGQIDGIIAVSIVSPVYDSNNDLIPVQAYEKPLILSPEDDISVSLIEA